MGVPKFFRFISERYPCLSEVVKEYEIPEFDNFYIDANGIIHNCSHPDDSIHFRITEEDIFKDIFYYLEVLFRLIQPRKLFFIAIDGVAPRAKMNQQRCRRFRTAKEVELALKRSVDKGEKLPDTDRFDSNCITPGTEFMDRLHKQLQYFIKCKISADETWQKPKIILSGHNVPGEGEHKIMDYIRYLRSRSDWEPNTRHCLHGLDADLIMLGLCTHEPYFSLLREEVKFSRNAKKPKNVEETKFYLLHLSMMRGYLDLEFQSLKNKLSFGYDIERIIDDWVLMGFLVGNDFIPNLHKFHIANNALHKLYLAYIEILPTLGGYINDYGTLNLERFEKYLRKLAEIELEDFKDIQADIKYFESKTEKSLADEIDGADCKMNNELLLLVEDSNKMLENFDDGSPFDSSDDEELIKEEFRDHKAIFYKEKLNYQNVDSEVLKSQAECYVRAIQWNLFYYYTGCPSWSWFYPHHYAPYVSDIKDFNDFDLKFDLSTPFLPFQQLLAVLPSASKAIVPEPFQGLMDSPDSPIIQFYPKKFETDLNDKKNDWEAVVLIPFIDEDSLLDAMAPYYKELTEEENLRNSVQPMEIYEYVSDSLGPSEAPSFFPTIEDNHAQTTLVFRSDITVDPKNVVKGVLPGAIIGERLGFPQLRGIQFKATLQIAKVKVFEHPSRGENMILKIERIIIVNEEEMYVLAEKLCNKVIYVGWPHIQKGKVTAISSENFQYKLLHNKPVKYEDKKRHSLDSVELYRRHLLNLGIDLGKVDIIIYVKTVEDIREEFDDDSHAKIQGRLALLWSKSSVPFPYQTCIDPNNIKFTDNEEEIEKNKDLKDIFTAGRQVFLLDGLHYGSFGKVKSVLNEKMVEVGIKVQPHLNLFGILELSFQTDLKYYPGSIAAQRLGIGGHLFSRLTGSIWLQNAEREEKVNVGLGLKFTKQGEELVGFTRREGNVWLYSEKTIKLLDDYMAMFPELFERLLQKTENDVFVNKDVFPENTDEKINEIKTWLKTQSHSTAERRPSGSQLLTPEAMKEIEKRVLEYNANKTDKTEDIEISPSCLYLPKSRISKAPPDPYADVHLLDRIISVRKNHFIPLGLMGTVVGIDKPTSIAESLFDILFDSPVLGGTSHSCDQPRIYRLPYQAFINISYSIRKREETDALSDMKMARQTNAGETWRTVDYNNIQHGENKLIQWTKHRDVKSPVVEGNESVKQFIKKFHSVKVPVNRIPNERRRADSEFHAMWNVLQNQKLPEEKSLRPGVPATKEHTPPVKTAVAEQTNALRKMLKLNETSSTSVNQHFTPEFQPQLIQHASNISSRAGNVPVLSTNNYIFNQGNVRPKTCSHINCYSELRNICVNKSIHPPRYDYKRLASSGEITCIITFFNEIGTVVGDSCRSQEEAAENASCKAIKQILKREEVVRSPLGFRNLQQQQPQASARHSQQSTARMGMNQQLPTPPMQWCSSSRTGVNSEMQYPSGMKKLSNRTSQEQGRPSHTTLGPVVMNSSLEVSKGCILEAGKKEEAVLPYGNKCQQKTTIPNQILRKPVGKSKSRIAANFSVPLNDKK